MVNGFLAELSLIQIKYWKKLKGATILDYITFDYKSGNSYRFRENMQVPEFLKRECLPLFEKYRVRTA